MRGRYPIHEGNMAKFKAEMARLVKVAEKLGCRPPQYRVVGEEMRPVADPTRPESFVRYVLVEVEGEAPKLSGWRFVGKLEHVEGGTIVWSLPGVEMPEAYRHADPKCDHCRTRRFRKDTFVVVSQEGEYKQVGSSCLKDFLGHPDPHVLARYMEHLRAFFEACEGEWSEPGSSPYAYWSLREYLRYVLAVIRQHGWRSNKRARAMGVFSTADQAVGLFTSKDQEAKARALAVLRPEDEKLIERALEWVRSIDPEDEYQHNLQVACSSETMDPAHAGLVASLLVAYRPELARREGGRHVGEVGQKVELEVTVMQVLTIQGRYGVSHLHVFEDREGNELVWFASSTVLEPGAIYRLTGTVKRHETYKGRPRTVLTRCKAEIIGVLDKQGNERVLATA